MHHKCIGLLLCFVPTSPTADQLDESTRRILLWFGPLERPFCINTNSSEDRYASELFVCCDFISTGLQAKGGYGRGGHVWLQSMLGNGNFNYACGIWAYVVWLIYEDYLLFCDLEIRKRKFCIAEQSSFRIFFAAVAATSVLMESADSGLNILSAVSNVCSLIE